MDGKGCYTESTWNEKPVTRKRIILNLRGTGAWESHAPDAQKL